MVISTQQNIDIAGVKDGIVIMKDGSYRLIFQVNAINFALKSEQEQNSLVFQYQGFLNSLHFPIQIVIRSKRLDLTPYLKKIGDSAKNQQNELIRMQTLDYVDFVGKLINLANIMKKSFYVAISYQPMIVHQTSFLDRVFPKGQVFENVKISDEEFKNYTDKLKERASVVASGLGSMGLHCFQLSTEEVIELFYQIYNPDEASKERVTDAASLSSPVVISQDEVKKKDKDAQPTQKEDDNMIDNSQIVIEQHKQEAEIRRQESEKQAEKQVRSPEAKETPAPAKTSPTPTPVAIPENVQAANLGATSAPAATPPAQPAPDQGQVAPLRQGSAGQASSKEQGGE